MFPSALQRQASFAKLGRLIVLGVWVILAGCNATSQADAEPQRRSGQRQSANAAETAAVNVAVAREGTVREAREYTGTTQPVRLVSLRSQVEGQLLNLAVTVGDPVARGQTLAQVDATVLATNVAEAQAEVAARESEVAQAQIGVTDAQAQVNRVQAELQQAQSDLNRLQYLLKQGAISEQQVEQARTQVNTAEANLRSTQEQVRTRQQAVAAARERVAAQRAVVTREQERQSFTTLTSPVTGAVVEQPLEPGNLIQPGTEVLRLGDFSQVKVAVQISELELQSIRLGQSVQVRLDAFPNQVFAGRITRISPAADPVARLVPIEVTIPNPNRRIGSGLLARVVLVQRSGRSRVVIPETALQVNEARQGGQQPGGRRAGQSGDNESRQKGQQTANRNSSSSQGQNSQPQGVGTVFVLSGADQDATVIARQVALGRRGDGQVEVISGLRSGERFVARSNRPLKSGDAVRLSILSEGASR